MSSLFSPENLAPTLFIITLITVTVLAIALIERHRTPQVFSGFEGLRHDERLFCRWDPDSACHHPHASRLISDWQDLSDAEIWYRYMLSQIGFTITSPNAGSARRWFLKHWQKTQEPASAYQLGILSLTGLGTEENADEALEWFKRAEQGNIINAITAQGVMLLREGSNAALTDPADLHKSQREAFALFEQASAWHDPIAMLNLAYCLEQGLGTTADEKRAMKFYLMAANKGLTAAQYRLSMMFAAQNNLTQAYQWAYVAAVCSESEIARQRYQTLGQQMSDAYLEHAQQLATYTANGIAGPRLQAMLKASKMILSFNP